MAKATNDPTSRRAVIKGAALAAAAAALAAVPAVAAPPQAGPALADPLLEVCARYYRQSEAVAAAGEDDAKVDEEADALCKIEWQIIGMPAATVAGALAKIELFENELREGCMTGEMIDLGAGLALSVVADFRRLLG